MADQQTYSAQTQHVRQHAVTQIVALWRALGSYRDSDMAGFLKRVLPILLAVERAVAGLTAAHLGGKLPTPSTVTGAALRGVDPALVYERPFRTVWAALSEGQPIGEAVKRGEQRLTQLVETDVQLARTHAARQVLAADHKVVGYRRVLNGAHSCALCVIASTRSYRKADLLPIHPGCDCSVEPLYGSEAPPTVLDESLLARTEADMLARFGSIPRDRETLRSLVVTHQHGELGPVLAVAGQHFTNEHQI